MKYVLIFSLTVFLIACGTSEKDANITSDDEITVIEVDSVKWLTDKIQENSSSAINWANRGRYFFSVGNVKGSKKDYEEAILRDSLNADYRVRYADILVAFLDLSGAKYNYEYALKQDSLNARAYVGMGHIFTLIDNPGMATVYLNKAYGINQNLPQAYFLEGLIYRVDFDQTAREESWKRAKSSFQTATELKPNYYEAYLMLGDMNSQEDNDLALDYYSSAIEVAPKSSEAWYAKGGYYQNHKKYDQAKYCYRKIIEFDTLYFDAFYNQGFMQLNFDKNFDSSAYFFEKCVEIDSLSARAYNNLGLSQEYIGEIEKAKLNYKKSLKIDPDYDLAKKNLRIVNNK
ncbi:MAG: tetratricopeptide repeat protein [Crocinitomicaceae bacterium]